MELHGACLSEPSARLPHPSLWIRGGLGAELLPAQCPDPPPPHTHTESATSAQDLDLHTTGLGYILAVSPWEGTYPPRFSFLISKMGRGTGERMKRADAPLSARHSARVSVLASLGMFRVTSCRYLRAPEQLLLNLRCYTIPFLSSRHQGRRDVL